MPPLVRLAGERASLQGQVMARPKRSPSVSHPHYDQAAWEGRMTNHNGSQGLGSSSVAEHDVVSAASICFSHHRRWRIGIIDENNCSGTIWSGLEWIPNLKHWSRL